MNEFLGFMVFVFAVFLGWVVFYGWRDDIENRKKRKRYENFMAELDEAEKDILKNMGKGE